MTATRRLGWWVAATAVTTHLFWFASVSSSWARRGFGPVGRSKLAPLNISTSPLIAWQASITVVVAVAVVAAAHWAWTQPSRRTGVMVALLIAMTFAPAVVAVRGLDAGYVRPLRSMTVTQYPRDVPLARDLGARATVVRYEDLLRDGQIRSIHSITHPPGPLVVLAALDGVFEGRILPQALLFALAAALMVLPAAAIGRRLGGDRAAVGAALLTAVTPSVAIHTVVSVDAAIATLMVAATALLMSALADGGVRRAAGAGAVIALCTFFTYAMAFPVVIVALWALGIAPWRAVAQRVGLVALGGVLGLVALRVGMGFDLLAIYRASHDVLLGLTFTSVRPYLYWLVGSPVALLLGAGIPLAGLTVQAVVARDRLAVAATIAFMAIIALPRSVTGLIPGEVERTWLFAYPIMAAIGGATLARASVTPRTIAVFTGIAATQAVILEALFFWPW